MRDEPGIVLVTGVMASGKSTVAQLLAERFERSVHVRGDMFRKMVVNGRVEMSPDVPEEAERQLLLRYRLAASTADAYREAGFRVVVQDVAVGPMLSDFVGFFRTRPLHVVVLCPRPDVVAEREAARGKKGYGAAWTPAMLDDVLRGTTPRIGLWLDTSDWTAERTVDEILRRLPEEGGVE
ncbi:phosphotransferase [Paenibacillus flagellatus]|uniref:Phosphotransferase n=2 Tax=Paenibacillus flagellatus TaxID=2211139 RepID=A0A2V5L3Z1_9BACL|nr:phosphotransferase [Paenibacillus flagellatus]